jgi:hypothetical protein
MAGWTAPTAMRTHIMSSNQTSLSTALTALLAVIDVTANIGISFSNKGIDVDIEASFKPKSSEESSSTES